MRQMTRRASLALFTAAALGQTQIATPADGHWTKFLEWFKSLAPESFHTGRDVLVLYRTKLTREGLSSAEVDQAIGSVLGRITTDSTYNELFWNKHYERADPQFRTEPNAFLVEVVSKLKPGQALDLGMGEGRNSIFLAQLGWDVTGVDTAEAGVAKARKRAAALGLKVNALVENADKFVFGDQRWDLVCLLYAPGAQEVHDFDKRLAASLKPGGYVISEDPDDNPKVLADRWTAWERLGLKLIRLEYRVEKSDWGQPSFGRALFRKS